MAKIKSKRADFKKVFQGFEGIRCDTGLSGVGASKMANFRIRSDGSLEKRNGYEQHFMYPERIRGVWQGTVGDEFYSFHVAGFQVIQTIYPDIKILTRLPTTSGRVSFLKYGEELYLLDGQDLWVFRPNKMIFERASAYAPLYGQNWHPSSYGQVNEPLNLLTDRLRVHYLNTTGSTDFSLPYFAKTIDHVRVNGSEVSSYALNGMGDTLIVPSAADASTVEVAYTMDYVRPLAAQIKQCVHVFENRSEDGEDAFFYGAPEGYRLFYSTPVSTPMLNYCKVSYPTTDPIYVTDTSVINLGDKTHPITQLCRHHDRVMVWNSLGAWAMEKDKESGEWEHHTVIKDFGCLKHKDVFVYQNDLFLLSSLGLYRIHSNTGTPDDYRFTKLTDHVKDLFTTAWWENAFFILNTRHNEIWIRNESDTMGRVWVYNLVLEKWYCFESIYADEFFHWDGNIAFRHDNQRWCVFSEDLLTDRDTAINASYYSNYMCFDEPESAIRALRVAICGIPGNNLTYFILDTDHLTQSYVLDRYSGAIPKVIDKRLGVKRFHCMRFRISSMGRENARYYQLSLYTKS